MKYLLDTNICSRLIRSRDTLPSRLARLDLDACAISAITLHELAQWAQATGRLRAERIHAFVACIATEPFDALAAKTSARIGAELAGQPLGAYDLLIAGHALALGRVLVTADADFQRVPGLRTENWLE